MADINPESFLFNTCLNVNKLNFSYLQTKVLEDMDLTVAEGEFLCMLGSSGSGKTTLLRLLAGLEVPDSGSIFWQGQEVTGPSLERGIVFQEYSLFPWFRLRDNVAMAIAKTSPHLSKKATREQADDYLKMVDLYKDAHKYPHELSGGMRQRGAIARTIALGSPLLLMDEPFGALDQVNRLKLQELLLEIWSSSKPRRTVIFVTHDIDEALFLGDRVLVLGSNPGRVIADLALNAKRPRSSDTFFASNSYNHIREKITNLYREDTRQQIYSEFTINNGAGI